MTIFLVYDWLSCKNISFLSPFSTSSFSFQLERVVGWSSRTVLLCLATGYDLAHCLQLGNHHFEVQTWNMMNITSKHITSNQLPSLESKSYWLCFLRTCFTAIALSYLPVWLTLDYLSDLMYMVDMIITVHTGKYYYFCWFWLRL